MQEAIEDLAKVLYTAFEKGCKFDSWGEHFKFDRWMEAFDECGIDPYFYANRRRDFDEIFPWDHIDVGVTKNFLKREMKRLKGRTTPNCRVKCTGLWGCSF